MPHCLDSRLTDGVQVVSTMHRPHSIPQKHYFSASDTHFCYRLSEPQGIVWPEGLGNLKKFIHLIGSRICDLPVRSSALTAMLLHAPPVAPSSFQKHAFYIVL
jgi:hypothetical protein